MKNVIIQFDQECIALLQKYALPCARVALFIVFFWFGILKIVAESPANPLIAGLLHRIAPFITFTQFITVFGAYEVVIGILFLIPRAERIVIPLLALHMVTTFLPLALLPAVTWHAWFIPTLEGQYIIKNIVIITLAMSIAAQLRPLRSAIRQQ